MGVFGQKKTSSTTDPGTPFRKKVPENSGPFSLRGTSFPKLSLRGHRRKTFLGMAMSPMSVMSPEAKSPQQEVTIKDRGEEHKMHHSAKLEMLSPSMAAIQARTFAHETANPDDATGKPPSSDPNPLPDRLEKKRSPRGPAAVMARKTNKDNQTLTEHWVIDFNDLTIGKTIGHSSFGTVNEGKLNGTKVAVKTIEQNPASPQAKDILVSIKKEAELNCKLRHPNIVLFMGISVQKTKVCIVTELMARGNVRDLLVGMVKGRKIRLDWSLRQQWALDTAMGMAYLHSLNPLMIHRDLKTTNLLVDRGMNVKICDFGLSRFKSDKLMSAVGTVHFAAPEVLRNERYTEKVDLFSYGTVMWELYTRECVFKGLPQIEVYQAVVDGNMPEVDEQCDPRYRSIMRQCWATDASQRPSFREVIDRLSELVEELENET